jgi:hypothetical protein
MERKSKSSLKMINTHLIVDEAIYSKLDRDYIESALSEAQKSTAKPDEKIALFIVCTISHRWREGKWKNKEGLNYAIRIPRDVAESLSKAEMSQLVIETAQKVMKWDAKAA